MPVVRLRPAFERAVTERIDWLRENAPEEWLDAFFAGIEAVRRDLERFPESSPIVEQDARVVVRQRRFTGGLPYLVYYVHSREDPIREVFLTQLFHVRQRRPRPPLGEWPF